MNSIVHVNGKMVDASDACVSPVSSAVYYGKGVFSTVAIMGSEPFLWPKHWRRLRANSEKIGLELSGYSEAATRKALDDLIGANDVVDGRARITFYDERSSAIWPTAREGKTSLSVITGEPRMMPDNLRVGVSHYTVNSRSPLAAVKSCNYLENILALEGAKGRGFDEAIRLNEDGHVTSACMANVFWLKGGRLYTPSLSTGCLPGTTREFVLENIECDEIEAGIDKIDSAEAIFLTSAGLGITAVHDLDGKELPMVSHSIGNLIPKTG